MCFIGVFNLLVLRVKLIVWYSATPFAYVDVFIFTSVSRLQKIEIPPNASIWSWFKLTLNFPSGNSDWNCLNKIGPALCCFRSPRSTDSLVCSILIHHWWCRYWTFYRFVPAIPTAFYYFYFSLIIRFNRNIYNNLRTNLLKKTCNFPLTGPILNDICIK